MYRPASAMTSMFGNAKQIDTDARWATVAAWPKQTWTGTTPAPAPKRTDQPDGG